MAKEGKNNTNAQLSPDNAPESPELNIKNALRSVDTAKELLVLMAIGYILYRLLGMLGGFLSSLAEIFTKASAMYSAPIAVVKTLDWHIVFLGSALILSITTIACFMLGSVFGKKNGTLLVTDSKESITTLTESVKSLVESVKSLIGTKKPE
ncbi:hypothetical protein CMV24_02285 [Pseudomonas plecoglossicida]|uniref:Uncharacterized protein n=1 Tax=Pseudomonas plecoglossicida TaxID=70775 RepID=A0A2A3MBU6_PSEDL|nr:hypothetical protein [Pseudomonas plecoglossicida]PBJ97565.1 hypothetical protein CMV24_02285 [Pseudomonas plecoglossicida]